MTLYNCKHAGDQYRITKFDEHMNVESSYLCTTKECECPAGHRPRCRHREMLPRFIQRGTIGTEWCYDYDRGGWVQTDLQEVGLPPLPEGVQMYAMEDLSPAQLHNVIAEAVGEPVNPHVPAPRRSSWRRF